MEEKKVEVFSICNIILTKILQTPLPHLRHVFLSVEYFALGAVKCSGGLALATKMRNSK